MKEESKGIRHFFAAARYSAKGFRAMLGESAFRQELFLGVVHFAVLAWLRPAPVWWVLLSAAWLLVLIVETLNTAIESVVDLASPDFHPLAGRAKDLGSVAVTMSLILYFGIWSAFAISEYF